MMNNMGAYSEDYCYSHDIDCFFIVGGSGRELIHFASNGHLLPSFIDREKNERFRYSLSQVLSSDDNTLGVEINENNVKRLIRRDGFENGEITPKMIENYTSSFVMMAKAGFRSYDMSSGKLFLIAESSDGKDKCQNSCQLTQNDRLREICNDLPVISEDDFRQLEFHEEPHYVLR